MELHRPRQWGACWLACQLYEQLGLDGFWAARLRPSTTAAKSWPLRVVDAFHSVMQYKEIQRLSTGKTGLAIRDSRRNLSTLNRKRA